MTQLNMRVAHSLSQEEALKRMKALIEEAKAQYADMINGLREEWKGAIGTFSFLAMGLPVSGTVMVKSADVAFFGDLPLAASLFKGKIEAEVRKRVAAWLA